MSKHTQDTPTPAPWEWVEDQLLGPEGSARAWDDSPGRRVVVETDSGVYPPFGADRALIAAAPEMLAALRKCDENLEAALHGRRMPHNDLKVAQEVRAVIAKATQQP